MTPNSSIANIRDIMGHGAPILVIVTKSYESGSRQIKVYQASSNGTILDVSYNMAWLCGKEIDEKHRFKIRVGYQAGQYIAELLKEKAGLDLTHQTDYIT